MSKPAQNGSHDVLSAKEASTLLATLRPAAVLGALKHPDFAMVVAIAFSGFRVDANGLANPLVRRRLADEASRNAHFTEKLRDLAEQSQAAVSPSRQPSEIAPSPAGLESQSSATPDRSAEKYRVERDRLRREVSDEADRRRSAERNLGQAKTEALAASTSKAEADREALRHKQRAERLERKLRRLELENAQLRRLAGTSLPGIEQSLAAESHAPPAVHGRTASHESETVFVDAVRRLLDNQRWPAARAITEDVLRTSPNNEDALAIHAVAAEALGDMRASVRDLRSLVAAQIAHADWTGAARNLAQLLTKSAGHSDGTKTVREFFMALRQSGEHSAPDLRDVMNSLKASSPAAYGALKEAAYGDAASMFFTERQTGRVSADEALPISLPVGLPRSVTGRLAVGWTDRNETALVEGLRSAAAGADESTLTRLAAALEAATDGDGSYYRLLVRKALAGPAVVDASNAAWSGQEMIASPKPRLSQVTALRKALRQMGYFPILLIADANLPFVVDDPVAARKLVADGHITLATGGTDADVLILQEARRLHAPVVSNDYMTEWDPGQEIEKLQYSIAPTSGAVTIYR